MKKILATFLVLFIFLTCFIQSYAEETTNPPEQTTIVEETTKQEPPYLTSIIFNNGTLNSEFNSEIKDYTVTIDNNKKISISSYTSSDEYAQVVFSDIYDSHSRVSGINVSLKNSGGTNDYTFKFSNLKKASTSKNALLKDIKFNCGELSPKLEKDKFKYNLYIPSDLSVLKIDPIAEHKDTNVSGPVEVVLGKGKVAPVSISVTSGDGSVVNVYRFNIKRLDMTVKEYEKAVSSPNFKTVVTKSFYQQPVFYVVIGALAVVTVSITIVVVVYKKRSKVKLNDEKVNELEEKSDE